jgi:hypothetical protein
VRASEWLYELKTVVAIFVPVVVALFRLGIVGRLAAGTYARVTGRGAARRAHLELARSRATGSKLQVLALLSQRIKIEGRANG